MMTWYYSKNGVVALVCAENISMAKIWLKESENIGAKSEDLIPVITGHRWTKTIHRDVIEGIK